MDQPVPSPGRIRLREPFCCISHGLGAVLAAMGTGALLVLAGHRPLYIAAFLIYGVSLIVLYMSSALYHGLDVQEDQRNMLMRLDHTAIYLLIAGTYTPFCLITLPRSMGWPILAAQYLISLIGIVIIYAWKTAPHAVRVTLYLVMGWMITPALHQLGITLPHGAIVWMVTGGLAYTIGTVVFATNWPHLIPGRFSAHDLWHLFVLTGSATQFYAILRYVA